MSHLTQMAGLAVQNFVSAAVGDCGRGRADPRVRATTFGDDRQLLGRPDPVDDSVLLPIAFVFAIVLVVRAPFRPARERPRLHAQGRPSRSLAGRWRARSRSRSSARTAAGSSTRTPRTRSRIRPRFTDFLEIWALLAIPFALTYTFGRMVRDQRQGWALFAAMFVLWIGAAGLATHFETGRQPPCSQAVGVSGSGGNMEGKEVRFGAPASGLFAASTTARPRRGQFLA